MSQATRAIALDQAVKYGLAQKFNDVGAILDVAACFDTFLDPAVADAATPATKTATPAPAETVKPATKAVTATKAANTGKKPAAAATEPEPAFTKQQVIDAIDGLLKTGKKAETIALLKKYGAKSASSVKEEDYEAFLNGASKIAETEAEEDLTK